MTMKWKSDEVEGENENEDDDTIDNYNKDDNEEKESEYQEEGFKRRRRLFLGAVDDTCNNISKQRVGQLAKKDIASRPGVQSYILQETMEQKREGLVLREAKKQLELRRSQRKR